MSLNLFKQSPEGPKSREDLDDGIKGISAGMRRLASPDKRESFALAAADHCRTLADDGRLGFSLDPERAEPLPPPADAE